MSSQLDPAILAAITAEARQCFLDEDAPEYLQLLEQGCQDRDRPDFNALLRAAHSLKGGAGLASLSSLQQLAHKLEDVLVGLQQETIDEVDLAWALVEKSIDEVGYVVSQAHTEDDVTANPELIVALEALAGFDSESAAGEPEATGDRNQDLIRNTLIEDLEPSLTAIEELEIDAPEELVQPMLSGFVDECTFLAETLELDWLVEAVLPIEAVLESDVTEALLLTQEIILQLRDRLSSASGGIAEYLTVDAVPAVTESEQPNELVANTLTEELESMCQAIADLGMNTPEEVISEALTGFADECIFLGETLSLPWLVEAVATVEQILVECDPLEALLTVQELVEEIRQRRNEYLSGSGDRSNFQNTAEAAVDLNDAAVDSEGAFDFSDEDEELTTVMFAPPVAQEKIVAQVAERKPAANSQVRISLESLEGMTKQCRRIDLESIPHYPPTQNLKSGKSPFAIANSPV